MNNRPITINRRVWLNGKLSWHYGLSMLGGWQLGLAYEAVKDHEWISAVIYLVFAMIPLAFAAHISRKIERECS